MAFNTTFNNISVIIILWRSGLLVEETGVPWENRPAASHWQTLSHDVISSTPRLRPKWCIQHNLYSFSVLPKYSNFILFKFSSFKQNVSRYHKKWLIVDQRQVTIISAIFVMDKSLNTFSMYTGIHWQTLSHDVISSTPRLSSIRTHNISGDRH
jgi:hypothetical protein